MKTQKAILSLVNGKTFIINYNNDEESLWKNVAQTFYNDGFEVPNVLKFNSEDGTKGASVTIEVDDSLYRKEDRIVFKLDYDTFDLNKSIYESRKMRHIDAEKDIRYRYDMNPNNMGKRSLSIGVIAGVIGKKGYDRLEEGMVYSPFPSQLYWLRYYEKLKAGYKDYSEYLAEDENENEISNFFKEPSANELNFGDGQELFKLLAEAAKNVLAASGIEINFYTNKSPYNRKQTTSARKVYNKMCITKSSDELNSCIEDLIAIASPKYEKGTTVKSLFVKKVTDAEEQRKLMAEKLEWADAIVSSMEAITEFQQNDTKVKTYESPFGDAKIKKLTDEEAKDTLDLLNPLQRNKVIAIYDVKSVKQTEAYEKCLAGLHLVKESMLFHGSPNCNWISIIKYGLLLYPDSVICGKSLGNGLYLAPDSDKSAGYGSQKGSYWRGGNEDFAVMGLYRVATGNTYEPNGIIGGDPKDTEDLLKMFEEKGYDSTWLHAKNGIFVRDEVVVYKEEQVCLDKIIVYAA